MSEMTKRQATAYRLAGVHPDDARFHSDFFIRGRKRSVYAYTVLAIVWIDGVPHWSASVTMCDRRGRAIDAQRAPNMVQRIGHQIAADLLDGVGEDPCISVVKRTWCFVARKKLTSDERLGLPETQKPALVTVEEEGAERFKIEELVPVVSDPTE